MPAPLIDTLLPYTKTAGEEDLKKLNAMPPGVVGITTGQLGRYREFDWCLENVWLPPGSIKRWSMGVDVCHNFNDMARYMVERPEMKWLWILGDDHLFTQDLMMNLYERDRDVVVPLCLRRSNDFAPVLNWGREKGFTTIQNSWEMVKGKSGLMDWHGTCGNAGMLIKRHILEILEEPWFRAGQLHPGYSGSDLYFCEAVRCIGFRIFIDLDNVIGHINHMGIWPRRDENGDWHVDIRNG